MQEILQACDQAGMLSGLHGLRLAGFQDLRHSGWQGSTDSGLQDGVASGLHAFRMAWLQAVHLSGFHAFRVYGCQGSTLSGCPFVRMAWLQVVMVSGCPECLIPAKREIRPAWLQDYLNRPALALSTAACSGIRLSRNNHSLVAVSKASEFHRKGWLGSLWSFSLEGQASAIPPAIFDRNFHLHKRAFQYEWSC